MERAPVRYNLFLFTLDLDFVEQVDFGPKIYTIYPEESSGTFLVLSDRATTAWNSTTANMVLAQPYGSSQQSPGPDVNALNKDFFTFRTIGDEPTSGNLYLTRYDALRTVVVIDTAGNTRQVTDLTEAMAPSAKWAFDTSPKEAIEAAFPMFTVHGPALRDGYCGVITPSGTPLGPIDSWVQYNYVSEDLGPQASITRMDLGFTRLERTDLESAAISVAKQGEHYYVATIGMRPNAIFPGFMSVLRFPNLPYNSFSNPFDQYTIIYFVAPQGYQQSPTAQYAPPSGGEIIARIGGTFTNPVNLNPRILPDLSQQMVAMGQYFGFPATSPLLVYTNEALQCASWRPSSLSGTISFASNLVSSSPLGGGCFERLMPRRNLYKLDKESLEIEDAGEWDRDVFREDQFQELSGYNGSWRPFLTATSLAPRATGGVYVAGRTIKKYPHLLKAITSGLSPLFAGSDAYVEWPKDLAFRVPLLGTLDPSLRLTFFLNTSEISGPYDLSGFWIGDVFQVELFRSALSIYFHHTNVVAIPDSYQVRFTNEYSAIQIPSIRIRMDSDDVNSPYKGLIGSCVLNSAGAPDQLKLASFDSTIYISAWTFLLSTPEQEAFFNQAKLIFKVDGRAIGQATVATLFPPIGGIVHGNRAIDMVALGTLLASGLPGVTVNILDETLSYYGTDGAIVRSKLSMTLDDPTDYPFPLISGPQGYLNDNMTQTFSGEWNNKTLNTTALAAATRTGFFAGFNVSGKIEGSETYRVRSQTYQGVRITASGASGIPGLTYKLSISVTSGCTRTESFRVRYKDAWSSFFSLNWDANTANTWKDQGGQGEAFAALITTLTQRPWVVTTSIHYPMSIHTTATGLEFPVNVETDPGWLYTTPLRYDDPPATIEAALQAIGYIRPKVVTGTALLDGPVRFQYFNGNHGLPAIEGDPKPIKTMMILDESLEPVRYDPAYQLYTPLSMAYDGSSALADSGQTTSTVHTNSVGDYFVTAQTINSFINQITSGFLRVRKFSPDGTELKAIEVGTLFGTAVKEVNRFDEVVVWFSGTFKVYDSELVYKGQLSKPLTDPDWNYYSFSGAVATDRHHNYYLLASSPLGDSTSYYLAVFKYDQFFQFVKAARILTVKAGDNKLDADTSNWSLIVVNDHVVAST